MPYSPPNFNLSFNWWALGTTPATDFPTDLFPGQLYVNSRQSLDVTPSSTFDPCPPIFVRAIPGAITIIAPNAVGTIVGYFNSDAAHDFYYLIRWWEMCHVGFANQYMNILVEQCDAGGLTPDPNR